MKRGYYFFLQELLFIMHAEALTSPKAVIEVTHGITRFTLHPNRRFANNETSSQQITLHQDFRPFFSYLVFNIITFVSPHNLRYPPLLLVRTHGIVKPEPRIIMYSDSTYFLLHSQIPFPRHVFNKCRLSQVIKMLWNNGYKK